MMPKAGEIQAIDRGSVHRICSGQVVLNLATAIKELVENSLDAGANNIEIKLKEYGSESIEVIDNGSGVKEENFEGLTLKHHTSKLRDFNDLTSVDTFGFRGEALSSLCALSKMTITTCHESSATGMKLQFDHQGHIVNKTAFARQPGTTVLIQQVFSTLPVRHEEFLRNLKKEFHKMVHVLNGYCLISTKVKVTCTNQTNKGHKSTVLATSGGANIRENITNIFGPKQVHSLMEFCQVDPDQHLCEDFNIKPLEERQNPFRIEGYVSSCEHGQGRSTNDRQFIFINKRPCDHTKVCRLINDVYHSYNRHQNPFVILNITLASESVDVNVTPDKRQIFMEEEKLLLATLKASLLKLYESTPSTYRMMEVQPKLSFLSSPSPNEDCSRPVKNCSNESSTQKPVLTGLASLKRSFSSSFAKNTTTDEEKDTNQKSKQRKLDTFVKTSHSSPRQHSPAKSPASLWKKSQSSTSENDSSRTVETIILTGQASFQRENNEHLSRSVETNINNSNIRPYSPKSNGSSHFVPSDNNEQKGSDLGSQKTLSDVTDTPPPDSVSCDSATELSSSQTSSQSRCRSPDSGVLCAGDETGTVLSSTRSVSATCSEVKDSIHTAEQHEMTVYDEAESSDDLKVKTVPFSMKSLIKKSSRENLTGDGASDSRYCRAFRAKIVTKDNKSAEEELQREISKDMFPRMEVIGQFNLGFILARLGKDLFIVDQHATDEKYNFEMLQQHTVIQSQKLIQPQNLELTAANESILLDNLEVFHKNGFDFEIDMTAPSTQRVKLTTMPVSKGWIFDKNDIEELIFMLSDSPGIMCRPSRIRQMFASRACRKSIMVGTALNQQEMKKVLNHMAELDQPWNCPHGRPTMRHLINLDMVSDTPDQE